MRFEERWAPSIVGQNMYGSNPAPLTLETVTLSGDAQSTIEWVAGAQGELRQRTIDDGALLLRNSGLTTQSEFLAAIKQFSPRLDGYLGGMSPRTSLGGGVYTSTELSSSLEIPLHIEGSYLPQIPRFVLFLCTLAPSGEGRTPIGDMSGLEDVLPESFVEKARAYGIEYQANLHAGSGMGKSWQATFETGERGRAEEHLSSLDCGYEWLPDGCLRVSYRAEAFHRHEPSGKNIWVAQIATWHPYALGENIYRKLQRAYPEPRAFPKMVFFGNGEPINEDDVHVLMEQTRQRETKFEWRTEDLLILDNHRVAHGRERFAGERSIWVAMTTPLEQSP